MHETHIQYCIWGSFEAFEMHAKMGSSFAHSIQRWLKQYCH